MFLNPVDPVVSRRQLLATTITGFIPWPATLLADDKTIPDFSFVVVSDTHLGRDGKADAADQWSRTAKEIDAATGDLVLHLGDVVDNGREKQYAVYHDIRKTIRKPVHEIPGNHDRHESFAKHVRKSVDTSFDHQGIRFVLLNNSRIGLTDGFVTTTQLKWLIEQCDEAASKKLFIILAMHVPIHDNAHPDPGAHVRPGYGQKELYALITRHQSRVLATFHGHFHCGMRGWDDHAPLQEVIFPSALFNLDNRLAEKKAPGYNLPEFRPGFATVSIGRAGLTLRYQPVSVAGNKTKVCPLRQFQT